MSTKKNATFWKIAIPIAVVWGVIIIFKAGYSFGVWLFALTH
jgi:hypothetical protein